MDKVLTQDDYINPAPGDIVQHYKGGKYKVLLVAMHCDDKREHVVYHSLKDGSVWIRLLTEFRDMVQTDDGLIKRFNKI